MWMSKESKDVKKVIDIMKTYESSFESNYRITNLSVFKRISYCIIQRILAQSKILCNKFNNMFVTLIFITLANVYFQRILSH